jgi:hypothetical protein
MMADQAGGTWAKKVKATAGREEKDGPPDDVRKIQIQK